MKPQLILLLTLVYLLTFGCAQEPAGSASTPKETNGSTKCEFSDPAICDFIHQSVTNAMLRPSHSCLSGDVFKSDKAQVDRNEEAMALYMWESFIEANLPAYYYTSKPTPFKGKKYYRWQTLDIPWHLQAENFTFNWAKYPKQTDVSRITPPLVKTDEQWNCLADENCKQLFANKVGENHMISEIRFNAPLLYSSMRLSQDARDATIGSDGYLSMGQCGTPITSLQESALKNESDFYIEPSMSMFLHWVHLKKEKSDLPLDEYCHITSTAPNPKDPSKQDVWGLAGMDIAVKANGHWSWNWATISIAPDLKYCKNPSDALLSVTRELEKRKTSTSSSLTKMNNSVRAVLASQNSLLKHYQLNGIQYVDEIIEAGPGEELTDNLKQGLQRCENFAQESLILPNVFITKDQQYAIPFSFLTRNSKSYSLEDARNNPHFYDQQDNRFISPIKEANCAPRKPKKLTSEQITQSNNEAYCNPYSVGKIAGSQISSPFHKSGQACMGCHVTASITNEGIDKHQLIPTWSDFICSFDKTGVPRFSLTD